jgi:hypothetical protein
MQLPLHLVEFTRLLQRPHGLQRRIKEREQDQAGILGEEQFPIARPITLATRSLQPLQ